MNIEKLKLLGILEENICRAGKRCDENVLQMTTDQGKSNSKITREKKKPTFPRITSTDWVLKEVLLSYSYSNSLKGLVAKTSANESEKTRWQLLESQSQNRSMINYLLSNHSTW